MPHEVPPNNGSPGSPIGSPKSEYISITDKSIRYLKSTNKRRVVWARGLPGLGIRITPKGTKSFVFKYDLDGRDRWVTFGQYPKVPVAEALRKYSEALDKVERGEDPAEESVRKNEERRKSQTVRDLAKDYIDKYAKPRKRTWKEDERVLNLDVIPRWGSRKASKISRRNVIELLDEIVARGAPVQANRTLAVIRRMFNFAIDRDVVTTSPCQRLKPPSPEMPKDRYLTLDEVGRFWRRIDTAPASPKMKLALKLLLLTLQRCSEVIGMNTSEINLKSGTWIIPSGRTKNKKAQLVVLSPMARDIVVDLASRADETGFLFPGKGSGNHITASAVSRVIARNLDHFGMGKFTPHDLRRTGSTQLAAFKVPRFDRDRILNHTDATIGSVYDVHEYQDEKRAALNLWSDIVKKCAECHDEINTEELQQSLKYVEYLMD